MFIVGAAPFINGAKKMLIVGAAPFINGCTVYKRAPQLSADSWCSTVYKWCKLILGAQHIYCGCVKSVEFDKPNSYLLAPR